MMSNTETAEVILARKVREQKLEIECLKAELNNTMQILQEEERFSKKLINAANHLLCKTVYFLPEIQKTIFQDYSTIIYWGDGTKTVVTCKKEKQYNKEKGFYLCILKKLAGGSTTKLLKLIEPVMTEPVRKKKQ